MRVGIIPEPVPILGSVVSVEISGKFGFSALIRGKRILVAACCTAEVAGLVFLHVSIPSILGSC
jgi:hypothetical protein